MKKLEKVIWIKKSRIYLRRIFETLTAFEFVCRLHFCSNLKRGLNYLQSVLAKAIWKIVSQT